MKRRLLGGFLALVMVLGLMPASAYAQEETGGLTECICETACTAESMNAECPHCSVEDASPEDCGKYVSAEDDQTDAPAIISDEDTSDTQTGDSAKAPTEGSTDTGTQTDMPAETPVGDTTDTGTQTDAPVENPAEDTSNNGDPSDDTLTNTGAPNASVELNLEEVLADAAVMGTYDAEPVVESHAHPVCGDSECSDHDDAIEWTPISSFEGIEKDGNYYLEQDVELIGVWSIDNNINNINLCLNGHSITNAASMYTISIPKNKIFTISDCQNKGKITASTGQGISNFGTFNMYGGTITITSNQGVYNAGIFNMYGGTITGCSCGVNNKGNATINMSGNVTITGNGKDGTQNNLDLSSNTSITVGNDRMGEKASVGITGKLDQTVVTGTTNATAFTCDNTDHELVDNGAGGLKIAEKSVTINSVTLLNTVSGEAMTNNRKVYDGHAVAYREGTYEPEVSGVVLSYTWQKQVTGNKYTDMTGNAAPSEAGNYRLHVEAKRGTSLLGTENYDFTIAKADGSGTVTMTGWTYGNTANNPVPASTTNGTDNVTYQYKDKEAEDSTYTDNKPTNAGTYTVKATFAATDNYNEATATADFTIAKAEITINITGGSYEYNGAAQEPTEISVSDNKVAADALIKTYKGTDGTTYSSNKAPSNVGKYTMTVSVPEENLNYTGSATCDFEITKKPLNVIVTAEDKTYDGTTTATVSATLNMNDVIEADKEKVALDAAGVTAAFADNIVGENKNINITGSYILTGAAASNYELVQPTGITASIKAYTATGKEYSTTTGEWSNQNFVVTAAEGWLVSTTNTADGTWTDSLTASEENSNGTLEFYVKNTSSGIISEKITEHYKIDKTAPVISGADNGKTYDSAVTLTITDENLASAKVNGTAVTLTEGKLTLNPAEGTQTVTATDKAGNSTSLTVTVNKKDEAGKDETGKDETDKDKTKKDDAVAKKAPVIIQGDNAKVTQGTKKTLSFTSDAEFADFLRVEVDGKTLDSQHYTVASGSTVVTLNADYVAGLSVGEYRLGIVSENGTATARFTVEKKKGSSSSRTHNSDDTTNGAAAATEASDTSSIQSAATGDNTDIQLYLLLVLASIGGIAGIAVRRKRTV